MRYKDEELPACGEIELAVYRRKEVGELLARFVYYHLSGVTERNSIGSLGIYYLIVTLVPSSTA